MSLPQYTYQPDVKLVRVYYTGTTALVHGGSVYWTALADPNGAAFDGHEPGEVVDIADGSPVNTLFAGIVHKSSAGSVGGSIVIQVPVAGQVITEIACDVGVDFGDGLLALASEQRLDDSGAWAAGDLFRVLFDEDSANNPYGTSAIDANTGLVNAVYTPPIT